MPTYTCNTRGNNVEAAKARGFNAYHANNVTAIEIPAADKREAGRKAATFGPVLYVFE